MLLRDPVHPRRELLAQRLSFGLHSAFPERLDLLVRSPSPHVDGDGAGGDGDWYGTGDPGERDRGERREPFDLHPGGVTDAPRHGRGALVAGVQQAPQVLVVSAVLGREHGVDLVEQQRDRAVAEHPEDGGRRGRDGHLWLADEELRHLQHTRLPGPGFDGIQDEARGGVEVLDRVGVGVPERQHRRGVPVGEHREPGHELRDLVEEFGRCDGGQIRDRTQALRRGVAHADRRLSPAVVVMVVLDRAGSRRAAGAVAEPGGDGGGDVGRRAVARPGDDVPGRAGQLGGGLALVEHARADELTEGAGGGEHRGVVPSRRA